MGMGKDGGKDGFRMLGIMELGTAISGVFQYQISYCLTRKLFLLVFFDTDKWLCLIVRLGIWGVSHLE
jgi:hypothetical protein